MKYLSATVHLPSAWNGYTEFLKQFNTTDKTIKMYILLTCSFSDKVLLANCRILKTVIWGTFNNKLKLSCNFIHITIN
jgi:hypothetical protein